MLPWTRASALALCVAASAVASGCAAFAPLPTTPRLEALTEPQVFATAPSAEWPVPAKDDAMATTVDVACGVGPAIADGTIYAAVTLRGRQPQGTVAPLNLSLVLDRSGSMSGKPFSNMLQAAEAVVGQMRDGDRVSIVVFSDGLFEAVPPLVLGPNGRAAVVANIRALRDGGGTNLGGGLLSGIFEVFSAFSEWQVNQVVLLSDGEPNVGVTDPNQLFQLAENAAEHGVGVTTIGFGTLHDEILMQGLADAGGGTYHYVGEPQDLGPIFQQELAAMLRSAVRSSYAVVDLPAGLALDDVIGWDYVAVGNRVYVRIGSVPFGEERYAVLKLKPRAGGGSGRLPIAVSYSDVTRRAKFGVDCAPAWAPGAGGRDAWALELAGRAEAAWGFAEAMGWADGNSDVYAISQLGYTRGVIAALRARLGPGALTAEDQMLAGAQARLGIGVASEATSSYLSGGIGGLLDFGKRTAVNTASAAVVDAAFKPLVRSGVQVTFTGQTGMRYSARGQRRWKQHEADKSNKYKQARFDAYLMMRARPR